MIWFFIILGIFLAILMAIPSAVLGGAIMLGLLVWMISEGMIFWIIGSMCALVVIGTISNN
jgi:hypothetical protein